MKEIKLTQGKFAIVDDEDFEELSKYRWCYKDGYATRGIAAGVRRRTTLLMHVVIIGKVNGLETDHINGNGLDNRRENLRHVTSSQNQQNRASCKNTSSQYKGVHWSKANKNWTSHIRIAGEKHHLGIYGSELEAAIAYNEAAQRLFGEYARLNIVKEMM